MSYDFNGNFETLTEGGNTTTYTWDVRDRLTNISGPGFTASFAYDAILRRTQKTLGGFTTTFHHDGARVVKELTGGSTVTYLHGSRIDEPLARIEDTGATCYLADDLGSMLGLADGSGAVTTEYTYEPFGRTLASGAPSPNPFQFTGRENDGTGLYYYRARYYHPGLARFTKEDPIGLAGGGPNFYAYVLNNPTNFRDPFGLDTPLPDGFPSHGGPGGSVINLSKCCVLVSRNNPEGKPGQKQEWIPPGDSRGPIWDVDAKLL
jgi:RHS repeat-associated protein